MEEGSEKLHEESVQDVLKLFGSNEINSEEREFILNEVSAMSYAELQNAQDRAESELGRLFNLTVITRMKQKLVEAYLEERLRDSSK